MARFSPRLILPPLAIIAAALGVSWWMSRQTDVAVARIRTAVVEWCDAAGRGEDPATRLPADTVITRRLGPALVEACAGEGDRIRVQVAEGPGPGHHAVKATHHALILRDGTPRVGINFLVGGDGFTIVGYWTEP